MKANSEGLKRVVSSHLAETIQSLTPVAGGDISHAFRAMTRNGKSLFIKTHPHPPPQFFEAESLGLAMLQKTKSLAVPAIHAVISEPELEALILEWVEPGPMHSHTSEEFGRGLAMLHRSQAPYFGLDTDNYIGTLKQPNSVSQNWTEFFDRYRIRPQMQLAQSNGLLPESVRLDLEALLQRLPELVDASEPPSPLHGDLWGGNRLIDASGNSWLIDPAFYFGNREVDLAMMKLFGGFNEVVFDAYAEAFPLPAGWRERTELYQLYPMLVHLNLFGASYLGSVANIVKRYL